MTTTGTMSLCRYPREVSQDQLTMQLPGRRSSACKTKWYVPPTPNRLGKITCSIESSMGGPSVLHKTSGCGPNPSVTPFSHTTEPVLFVIEPLTSCRTPTVPVLEVEMVGNSADATRLSAVLAGCRDAQEATHRISDGTTLAVFICSSRQRPSDERRGGLAPSPDPLPLFSITPRGLRSHRPRPIHPGVGPLDFSCCHLRTERGCGRHGPSCHSPPSRRP